MNPEISSRSALTSSDLVGCRFRLARDLTSDYPRFTTGTAHQAIEQLLQNFPSLRDTAFVVPGGTGDSVYSDLVATPKADAEACSGDENEADPELETLEAIARGEDVIIGAVLSHHRPQLGRAFSGIDEICRIPLLVKLSDAPETPGPQYLPIIVVPHRLLSSKKLKRAKPARRTSQSNGNRGPSRVRVLAMQRLWQKGVLGRTMRQSLIEVPERKLRHHGPDAVRLGQAAALLHRLGVSSGYVGAICRTGDDLDSTHIVVVDEGTRVVSYRMALRDARDTVYAVTRVPSRLELGTWPLAPRRIRECRTCHWQEQCSADLAASDDISLLLPGDKANQLREIGITTVRELAASSAEALGGGGKWVEQQWLARARVNGEPALRRVAHTQAPRADVEMDIDMEAYPQDGAYLWGTWVPGEEYRPFVTWETPETGADGLGGAAEALNFARFWDYVMHRKSEAEATGATFMAYCWAAEGENYWLRRSADRFGGMEFAEENSLRGGVLRVPTVAEVDAFINSKAWQDMFRVTRQQLLSPDGLGLKVVAPWAGFHWRDEDVDGEASLDLYRVATGWDTDCIVETRFEALSQNQARAMLLRYNGDDCRSVAVVREWLDSQRAVAQLKHGRDLQV